MELISTPLSRHYLLIWRTEFLFCTPERRRLADEWNHVRFTSASLAEEPHLINHPLDGLLPLGDETFDAIYTFHVVEHLSPRANEDFMRDVHRLLKPGGICRASTPDLEFMATEYLKCLHEQMASSSPENYARYRWALCNLIDQSVRQKSGGEMLEEIRRGELVSEHVRHMNGDLLAFLFPAPSGPFIPERPKRSKPVETPATTLRKVARKIRRRVCPPVPKKSYLELTHERNLWFFDTLSLGRLFSETGFEDVTVTDHRTSGIPSWNRYNFDQSPLGDYPLEPSLYMEGRKARSTC